MDQEDIGEGALEAALAEYDTIKKIVEQLESCGFTDTEGHKLEGNVAFIALKRMSNLLDK